MQIFQGSSVVLEVFLSLGVFEEAVREIIRWECRGLFSWCCRFSILMEEDDNDGLANRHDTRVSFLYMMKLFKFL